MRLIIGSDHAGFEQKELLRAHLIAEGHDIVDAGTFSEDSVDYPDFAIKTARSVAAGEAELGILVCGTGIGVSIAANKVHGVRAANVTMPEFAELARMHNNANVVTVSGRFVPYEVNERIVDTFISTEFEGGRHQGRIDKITAAEQR